MTASPDAQLFSISIVVPMHNEEENVDAFFSRLSSVLETLTPDYEIICVNDGSTDGTLNALLRARERDARIKVVSLSRNFGKENALTAGLDRARGDAVVPIDADLQDPPDLIPDLVAKWREGWDVVYARRSVRAGETRLKLWTAASFYYVINKLSDITIPANVGDFRLMDQRVIEAMRRLPERNRFMKGLFSWVGFRQTAIEYSRDPRYAGKTNWNYWKLWNFALDGVTSFSSVPLRVWTYIGTLMSLFSFLFALYMIGYKLFLGIPIPGYTAMMVVILFLGGVILTGLGIIGEYIGRIYEETKSRPLYIEARSWGIDDDEHRN